MRMRRALGFFFYTHAPFALSKISSTAEPRALFRLPLLPALLRSSHLTFSVTFSYASALSFGAPLNEPAGSCPSVKPTHCLLFFLAVPTPNQTRFFLIAGCKCHTHFNAAGLTPAPLGPTLATSCNSGCCLAFRIQLSR